MKLAHVGEIVLEVWSTDVMSQQIGRPAELHWRWEPDYDAYRSLVHAPVPGFEWTDCPAWFYSYLRGSIVHQALNAGSVSFGQIIDDHLLALSSNARQAPAWWLTSRTFPG